MGKNSLMMMVSFLVQKSAGEANRLAAEGPQATFIKSATVVIEICFRTLEDWTGADLTKLCNIVKDDVGNKFI